ncbi:uncharacterized protein NECHADRAFT_87919 [Fusarium vanettenii 77-13-4]|uniref:LysM domain-containing protein n=1 Tax=Fusarium vanettenii (strain ATCC MYA-4622 / CBS 123669 / FGSC 9596 / NRRL 45880 / 77-13-4) TaxID=660122 RepID=C7Z3E3_FUSV7|nr:uncharacterized protein NECHADRAFT_87919 [Fusarium vanettenii 77-13-4]EEU41641.1 hypothetical protein NECHADRAFT_87919 [Fusarium vanettenii 77-13-4]
MTTLSSTAEMMMDKGSYMRGTMQGRRVTYPSGARHRYPGLSTYRHLSAGESIDLTVLPVMHIRIRLPFASPSLFSFTRLNSPAMMHWSFVLSSLAIVASPTGAWQYISPDALPSDTLSSSCKAALVVDISCPSQVSTFFQRQAVPLDSLEEACTSECRASLAEYEAGLKIKCDEKDVVDYNPGANPVHVSVVATDMLYHFNRTCIKDGDRWCNIWAFENSPDSDPSGSSAPSTTASMDMCDSCIIKPFQFMAGNSYSDGFALQPDYSTLTESCSQTGFPLATTTTIESPTTSNPSLACSGKQYTIQANDTCQSISNANNVATAWMLYDNNLQAFCARFPAEGERICIVNQCKTYTIQANDTCQGIAVASNITRVQLYTWNPVLGPACNRMSLSVGDSICLEPHNDEDYTSPTHVSTTQAPKPTAAPVPSNIANGTNENCAQYYFVQEGDYCNQIIVKFGISLADFLFLNQGINAECTNLMAEDSYCVAPVGPINMYPGHPDYVDPTSTIPNIPFSDLPKATFTPPAITGLPAYLPRANSTRKDCLIYVNGTDLQVDMSWGSSFSGCVELAKIWGISLDELQNWNPSLNTTSPDCGFSEGFSYCMAAYMKVNTYTGEDEAGSTATSTSTASTPTTDTTAEPTETELPIRDGAAEGCTKYYAVVPPQTCQEVLDANNLTIAEFYAMNPSIGAECTTLWPNYRYCVEVLRLRIPALSLRLLGSSPRNMTSRGGGSQSPVNMAPSARKRTEGAQPRPLRPCVNHNVIFNDHTGNPSLMSWYGLENRPNLPHLPSWIFYMVNPEIPRDFDGCTFVFGFESNRLLYCAGGFRYEFFFLPGATAQECIAHYRGEMAARGTMWCQVRKVKMALKEKHEAGEEGVGDSTETLSSGDEDEPQSGITGEGLPGLPWPKRGGDWYFTNYRSWLFMYLDADIHWGPDQDHNFCLVKFDPMPIEWEEGERVRWDPMEHPIHSEHMKARQKVGDKGTLISWMGDRSHDHWAREASYATDDAEDLGWETW